jgi:capsular polysaccharide biosynthesis protein
MRRGWILLLLALIAAIAAFVFSTIKEQTAPVYKSTISILVQPSRTDFGQAQAAKTLLRSYVAWMDSNYRAADVIDILKLDTVPETLRSDVTIASDDSRLVIQIDVEQPNGDTANDIARTWADLFISWRDQENQKVRREDRIDAQIIDDPRYVLDQPKMKINVVAGAILGLLIGTGIVFALEFMDTGVIRSSEDVDRVLELPLLAAIPPTDS